MKQKRYGTVHFAGKAIKLEEDDYYLLGDAHKELEKLQKDSQKVLEEGYNKLRYIWHEGSHNGMTAKGRLYKGKFEDWEIIKLDRQMGTEDGLTCEYECRKQIRLKNHKEIVKVYEALTKKGEQLLRADSTGLYAKGKKLNINRNDLTFILLEQKRRTEEDKVKTEEFEREFQGLKNKRYDSKHLKDENPYCTMFCYINNGEITKANTIENLALWRKDYKIISAEFRYQEDICFNKYYSDIAKLHAEKFGYNTQQQAA